MTSLKLVKKCLQQLHIFAVCFCPLEEKNSQQILFPSIFKVQTVFTSISRLDKHTELLKIYFKPLVKKFRFSTLIAESDLRFKVH